MQVDEKARIAAADAIWNEFLYHVDTVACGDRFQTPDAAMARRISDIAIAAYLSALGEQKPVAWRWKQKGRTDADAWNYSFGHPQLSADLYVTESLWKEFIDWMNS